MLCVVAAVGSNAFGVYLLFAMHLVCISSLQCIWCVSPLCNAFGVYLLLAGSIIGILRNSAVCRIICVGGFSVVCTVVCVSKYLICIPKPQVSIF
jgi:hypothetical protein